MLTASKIIDLIIKHKGFKTDTKLAKYWGITPTTVTNWRKRNSIPFERIITFCKDEGISLDYIFTGEGEMIRKPEKDGDEKDDAYIYKEGESDDDPEIAGLLSMTREILKSDSDYSSSLAANVRSFHQAIKTEKRLQKMETRLSDIEDNLKKDKKPENHQEGKPDKIPEETEIPEKKVAAGGET